MRGDRDPQELSQQALLLRELAKSSVNDARSRDGREWLSERCGGHSDSSETRGLRFHQCPRPSEKPTHVLSTFTFFLKKWTVRGLVDLSWARLGLGANRGDTSRRPMFRARAGLSFLRYRSW